MFFFSYFSASLKRICTVIFFVLTVNVLTDAQNLGVSDYLTMANSAFDNKDYATAMLYYQKASRGEPDKAFCEEKMVEIRTKLADDTKLLNELFEKSVVEGEKEFKDKNYVAAKQNYLKALLLDPESLFAKDRIEKIREFYLDPDDQFYFDNALKKGDEALTNHKHSLAVGEYKIALAIQPSSKLVREKISYARKMESEYAQNMGLLDELIAKADENYLLQHYDIALDDYRKAFVLAPENKHLQARVAEVSKILGDKVAAQQQYNQAVADADLKFKQQAFELAKEKYQKALTIQPDQKYPIEMIEKCNAQLKQLVDINEQYAAAVAKADADFKANQYNEAVIAYKQASTLKSQENYPKQQITQIENILRAEKEKIENTYNQHITEGDKFLAEKEYAEAKVNYVKALSLKPTELYPQTKIKEIDEVVALQRSKHAAEYARALAIADKFYESKALDKAIDAYEKASSIDPSDNYPLAQIAKIKKYLAEHVLYKVVSENISFSENTEKKFTFKPIEQLLRKNNYIIITAKNTGSAAPKIFFNYGADGIKNGGIVLRNITQTSEKEYLIPISMQDKWYRMDNNWISIYVEKGSIDISAIQITSGD